MLVTSIFSFSCNIFFPSKKNFSYWVTFILSSANAFNLVWSTILSFGRVKVSSNKGRMQRIQMRTSSALRKVLFGHTVSKKLFSSCNKTVMPKGKGLSLIFNTFLAIKQPQCKHIIFHVHFPVLQNLYYITFDDEVKQGQTLKVL